MKPIPVPDRAGSPEAGPLIGSSPQAASLRRSVAELSHTAAHVLLVGEPGAGKRFLAGCIHAKTGRRKRGSVVEVTPRTPQEELRVILFDEQRRKQEGITGRPLPRLQRRSSLLVRNVHEFPLLSQTRIARFLIQNDRYGQEDPARVRVFFALPAPWAALASSRRMIDSLSAYCSAAREITVPPLRERREDIPAFTEYFLRALSGGRPPSVGPAVMEELLILPYYDNVRELRLLLGEALQISGGGTLVLPDLVRDEAALVESVLRNILGGKKADLESVLGGLDKALVRRALIRSDFDRARAAAMLGLTDLNFRYRLRKFRLRIPGSGTRGGPRDPRIA